MSTIYNLTKKLVAEITRINKSGGDTHYNKQYLKDLVCQYIDEIYKSRRI